MKSRIKPDEVVYERMTDVFSDDMDVAASPQQVVYKHVAVEVVLGAPKFNHIHNGVIFFPIYLVAADDTASNIIGVYEVRAGAFETNNFMGEDGEYDAAKLGEPLLFDHVTVEYLMMHGHQDELEVDGASDDGGGEVYGDAPSDGEESLADAFGKMKIGDGPGGGLEEGDGELDEIELDDIVLEGDKEAGAGGGGATPVEEPAGEHSVVRLVRESIAEDDLGAADDIVPQTRAEAKAERAKYSLSKAGNVWVRKYMRNLNYDIIDNEGGGDCFFAVVRDALASIGKNISVSQMRELVALNTTQEHFDQYYMPYIAIKGEYDDNVARRAELKRELARQKRASKRVASMTREELNMARDNARMLADDIAAIDETLGFSRELLEQFDLVKGIDSLEQFRDKIRSASYWADEHAITIIERELKVKMIILSKSEFREGSKDTVLQCGGVVDPAFDDDHMFTPKYYITTEYTGDHYRTVTYKGKKIFRFEELPYDLRHRVVRRCLERNSGAFYFIPKFRAIAERADKSGTLSDVASAPDTPPAEGEGEGEGEGEDGEDDPASMLYDENVVFQFYSKSSGKPLPGMGSGEKLSGRFASSSAFGALTLYGVNWRRILSDKHVDLNFPLEIDGMRWASVAHYMAGARLKTNHPDIARLFSMESEAASGLTIKDMKKVAKKNEDVRSDMDFNEEDARMTALQAKFAGNDIYKAILVATKPAKLNQFIRGKPAKADMALMRVRALL
jgi:predicted NAD-dependent protein-ADP-ribosyltransferase YbiA (DUF1768 family)